MKQKNFSPVNSNRTPAAEPANHSKQNRTEPAAEPQQIRLRRNPRLVIDTLDFFDLLMEQDEQ